MLPFESRTLAKVYLADKNQTPQWELEAFGVTVQMGGGKVHFTARVSPSATRVKSRDPKAT